MTNKNRSDKISELLLKKIRRCKFRTKVEKDNSIYFNEIFDIRPNENKKRYLNIIYNKLTSIVKDNQLLINLKESIDAVDNNRFYSLFAHLSYLEQRELYFYIYQDVLPKYNNILKRKKESNNE